MSHSDPASVDPALLELFRAEMDTHIPALSQGLLALEKGRAGEPDIAAMMRAAHSIKGAARIVGIQAAVDVAHVMEDCFTAAREARTPLVGAAVDVLLQGVDALQRICAPEPDPELTDAWLAALQEQLRAVKDGRLVAAADQPPPGDAAAARPLAEQPAPELHLVLPATLDDAAAEQLRTQLRTALGKSMSTGAPASAAARVCLDFSQVSGISAAGLAVLATLNNEARRSETAPEVLAEGTSGAIAALLRVTGLDRAWSAPATRIAAARGPEKG